ncbi:MAG TPA: OB-fold domain-containing protein, partial [Pseudonocardia sp.]|uniref:Zn-ribbon domain-containing OB-fold protein n=1 Tax=Pseudonocardia sp. TaxID=60912 RepID=UPI002ED84C21
MVATEAPLSAPLELGFDYTRSLGPVLSRFVTALRDRRVEGVRGSDGRVHVPPAEYDPVTGQPLSEPVPVADEGIVVTWSWQPTPLEGQPLEHPFAWALVQLDGADTALLHAVDAGAPAHMRTGMRVRIRWAERTVGHITDIACFEPVDNLVSGDGRDSDQRHSRPQTS